MSEPNGWDIAGNLLCGLVVIAAVLAFCWVILDNISHLSLRVKELEKKNGIPTKPYFWQIEKSQPTEGTATVPHASSIVSNLNTIDEILKEESGK